MTEIITVDHKMNELVQLAKTVAQSKATVLIQGESGTGKELIAALIHENSSRAGKSFIAINCAAIPETLLESELFGYEKGAFTGAASMRPGKFESAMGGTLLLDEISEMDVRLQAKLLRVIQEGEVDRIGGRRPVPVDVRIISTTNRNLTECIKLGTFREDLFYRLNVVNLTLPALRGRLGDVRVLSQHFLEIYSKKNKKEMVSFSDGAIALLECHSWPGNIRELENVIERAVITAVGGIITEREIYLERRQNATQVQDRLAQLEEKSWSPGRTLNDVEKNVILEALKYHHGNRTHTARALGISIRTLRNKLADYRRLGLSV